jgi:hypothetical protein
MNLARDIGNVKFCAQVTLHDLALRDQADKTSTAYKASRESGWDAISGRTTSRRALGIAISVWYDEPVTKVIGNRPTDWTFGQ